jgi:CRP-like cAMP-binding protein
MYKDLILECPFFNMFDTSFVVRIVPLLKPVKYDAGECIFRHGEYSSNVYFLTHGTLKFLIEYENESDLKTKGMIKKKKHNRPEPN